jgi:hypothetical protein
MESASVTHRLRAARQATNPARAQAPGPHGWHSLRVPGGVAPLLKAAGLDESLPRTRALRDVIQVVYETQPGTNDAFDARRRNFITYLESISAVEALGLDRGQPPPSLRQADDRTTRRRIEAIAEVIGCTLERESRVYRLQPEQGERQARRRADLASAGLDIDAIVKAANAGQPLAVSLEADVAPLPLAPEAWTSFVKVSEKLSGSLATAILGDRAAALLYFGLLGTDAATREFFQQNTALLTDIVASDRVAVFAGHSQGIRVAAGRVAVPGGPAAEPLWQDLAGESAGRPDRFILKLLDRDGGRLASLFDAVHALDSQHRAFVLGSWIPSPDARADRFRTLYGAYGRLLAVWDPAARPFVRPLYDGAHMLAVTAVDPAGQATGPTSVRLWRRVFDGVDIPSDPSGDLGNPESDGHVDAAWLLEVLADVGQAFAARRNRVEIWLFAQRVFSDAPRTSLPDVFVTLRGFSRFRALLCSLERMGVGDPKVYAAAVKQADRLSRNENTERAAVAFALFQGSVALIERARAARTLDAASAESLLRSLSALPMSESGEYLGGIGRWMAAALVPALEERLPPRPEHGEPLVEEALLRAMAGRALSMADSPNLGLWLEGLPYSVDVASSELARMRAVREKQRGVPLTTGLELGRAASALGAPGVSLAGLPRLASELDRAAKAVLQIGGPAVAWLDVNWYRKEIASTADDIRKLKKPNDLRKLERIALPFLGVADRLQAQAALSLAYAAILRDPQSTALLDGDPAPRHDWAFGAPDGELRQSPPWREPAPDRTGGWHLTGSILGADLALASESLRRVSVDRFPSPPTLSDSDAQTIAEAVALIVAFDQSDADREILVSALARGRQKMEDVATQPSLWADAAEAMQLRDFRRELLPWAIANEPAAVPALLSLGELALLGQLKGAPAAFPDSWGTSGRAYDGRWSLRYPSPLSFALLSGRKGGALVAGLVPDLVLSVAEAMHERQLPAALTRSVLECAARDAMDEVQLQYFDDWVTLIRHTRIVPERLDEYLASLTAGGPLVPVKR